MLNLRELHLPNTAIQQWDALKTAHNLATLSVESTGFSDLSLLSQMGQLQKLDLSRTTVTHSEQLAALPALEKLTLTEAQGIEDITMLKTAPKLSTLYVSKGQFPQEQIDVLKAALPNLTIYDW
jgi:hypothetical protein